MEKLLLIDDEKSTLSMLGLLLESYGYEVLTAENATTGLRLFRHEHPSILLTDIKMPGMDGIELLQVVKHESPDTEIIMITGHGDIELAIQSLKHDATDFITKPVNVDVLEIALKRAKERIDFRKAIKEYTDNLEMLVEEKTEKLLEAERLAAVGQTVAGLTHAIKNIAGNLQGGAYVLEKGFELKDDEYLSQGWDMVKANVNRISELALDLLNYSKERQPHYQLCHPNKIVQEVFELLNPQARKLDISLEMDLSEDLVEVWLDPEGIYRCLMNLLTNAIDACSTSNIPKKKTSVVIRSINPKDWAVGYEVVDNGCGMKEEIKNRVFQRFFSTKGSEGTGLGLMITKKIIDEHGGIIEMETQYGSGTKFFIGLPEIEQPPDA